MVVRNNRIVNTGPGDNVTSAYGLVIQFSENSQIVGNFISNTTETTATYGVHVAVSSLIEVRGNTVLDTDGATSDRGIYIFDGTDSTVIDNRVLNAAGTGTNGIWVVGTTSGINCIDNTIAGLTTATTGCDYTSGNHTP